MDAVIDSFEHWPQDYKARGKALLTDNFIFSRRDWEMAAHETLPVGLVSMLDRCMALI